MPVTGRVQGVGFRYFVAARGPGARARGLGRQLAGRVRPLRRRGPARSPRGAPRPAATRARRRAIVERVSAAWMPATGDIRVVRRPQRCAPGRLTRHQSDRAEAGLVGYSVLAARWPILPHMDPKSAAEELPGALPRPPRPDRPDRRRGPARSLGVPDPRRGDPDLLASLGRSRAARPRGPAPPDRGEAGRPATATRGSAPPERPRSPDGARPCPPRRLGACPRPSRTSSIARSTRTPRWPSSARRSRTSGPTSTTWPTPGATASTRSRPTGARRPRPPRRSPSPSTGRSTRSA